MSFKFQMLQALGLAPEGTQLAAYSKRKKEPMEALQASNPMALQDSPLHQHALIPGRDMRYFT